MKKIIAIVVLAAAVWFAWPYYTARTIAKAIDRGDSVTLEQHVSWDSVRQGFKEDINVLLARATANQQDLLKDNPFAGLAAAFLPVMMNKLVDAYMTPSGLATLMRERSAKLPSLESTGSSPATNESKKLSLKNVKYAFFTGPTSFLIELGDAEPDGDDDLRLRILMQFEDFGWKISRIYLPGSQLQSPA